MAEAKGFELGARLPRCRPNAGRGQRKGEQRAAGRIVMNWRPSTAKLIAAL